MELTAVKFCRVEEPLERRLESVANPVDVIFPVEKRVEKRLVLLAVVAKKLVEVELVEVDKVKTAVEGVEAPIGVFSIVPPDTVKLSATLESARVPVQPIVN